MQKPIVVFAVLFLAACASTPAERAARAERDIETMIQTYGSACNKLGYEPASDAWRGCVLHLAAQDDYKRYSQYNSMPRFTHCYAHKGFYNCVTL